METSLAKKIFGTQKKHDMKVPRQTGFASAATHYLEPSIDLNQELVKSRDSTFFIRVDGEGLSKLDIHDGDVLIVDRSVLGKAGKLAVIVEDGMFKVKHLPASSRNEIVLWGTITYIIHRAK